MSVIPGAKMVPVWVATCPDDGCKGVLIFPSQDKIVDCHACGQRRRASEVKDIRQMQEQALGVKTVLRSLLLAANVNMKKSADLVKVNGLSNYHCKLLSPLLTHHGMDKNTQKAKPLSELTNAATFDCSVLCDRSFLISAEHLDILGYGRDQSGSLIYLEDTLKRINQANGDRVALVPIHADADGHCLVHAVSRALVGRQLFWHPLRTHLKRHILEKKEIYKELLQDFINASEWDLIIEECDPDYMPEEDKGEILGLRNIHVFGLANILKRPVILLDSEAGMNCSGDYSAVFLPALVNPEECKGKNQELNLPLCLAWSSHARNHFIPLVGIEGEKLPVIPRRLLPDVWGVPQNLLFSYMKFDNQDCVVIGGNKVLQQSYIRKLAKAMDELFLEKFGVHPLLVCDMYQYNYKKPIDFPITPHLVTSNTQKEIQERRVFKCLDCYALCIAPLSAEWLRPGNNGLFYNLAVKHYGLLEDKKVYSFINYGVTCTYDAKKDVLVLKKHPGIGKCSFCMDLKLRLVYADGTIAYENSDLTPTRAISSHCQCGYKHWWNGKEYDNPPDLIPVMMTWKGREATEVIAWFQYESDQSLNSNVFQVASYVVQKHFPGEFGSERLVQKVVTQILEMSKCLDGMRKLAGSSASQLPALKIYHEDDSSSDVPTKIATKQHGSDSKPKPCTVTSPEGKESTIISCSEGPVAVHLQGNGDQSKKMAAMTAIDSQPTKDTSTGEKKQGLPSAEKDKTKDTNDVRAQKTHIGMKEQQLEYKLRKEIEYQTQLHRKARQLVLQTRPVQDPGSFHSTNTNMAGVRNYVRPTNPGKSKGRGVFYEPYVTADEKTDDLRPDHGFGAGFHYDGASTSRASRYMFPVDQPNTCSTKTVRVGPGYSVLALPKPSQSSTVTSESTSTWAEGAKKIVAPWLQRTETSSIRENHERLGKPSSVSGLARSMDSKMRAEIASTRPLSRSDLNLPLKSPLDIASIPTEKAAEGGSNNKPAKDYDEERKTEQDVISHNTEEENPETENSKMS